jgi:multiple sugar transport system substrate-binding protein
MYVDLIQQGGSPTWSNYTWYECAADLAQANAPMMFRRRPRYLRPERRGYAEAGNIAFAPCPMPSSDSSVHSKSGAGASPSMRLPGIRPPRGVVQYFTGKEYMQTADIEGAVNPTETPFLQRRVPGRRFQDGRLSGTFEATIGGTSILSVPQSISMKPPRNGPPRCRI